MYTSKVFKGEKFNLIKQKGVYPYDYMDSAERFNDQQLHQKMSFIVFLLMRGLEMSNIHTLKKYGIYLN